MARKMKATGFRHLARLAVQKKLEKQNQEILRKIEDSMDTGIDYADIYHDRPVDYMQEILGVTLTRDQKKITKSLWEDRKVIVRSSHGTGKSFLLSCLILTAYELHPQISGLALGATHKSMSRILWGQARLLAPDHLKGSFVGSIAPELRGENEDRFIIGASPAGGSGEAVQGFHNPHQTFVLADEIMSMDFALHESLQSIHSDKSGMTIYSGNPTTASHWLRDLEKQPDWKVIVVSSEFHENLEFHRIPGNEDKPPPFPGCVTLHTFEAALLKNSEPIKDFVKPTDVLHSSGEYYRPNVFFSTRYLGRWGEGLDDTVWTETLVTKCRESGFIREQSPPQIGVDVARGGKDFSVISCQQGGELVELDWHSGIYTDELTGLAKKMARKMGYEYGISGEDVQVVVDENGIGGSVLDQAEDFNFVGVNVSHRAERPDIYASRRSELWCDLADRAQDGEISFAGIPEDSMDLLEKQLLAPRVGTDKKGKRLVEQKELTKSRLKIPLDAADSVNLAFCVEEDSLSVSVV